MGIPLYIIEEHNEVFRVWNQAVEEGYLPPFGNSLLHVDHHPDFECGAYGGDMSALFGSSKDIRDFADCLGIADFICPAIYQGMFNEIVFLRDFDSFISKPRQMTLSLDASGCLVTGTPTPLNRGIVAAPEADHRFFTYSQGGLGGAFHTPQPIALDIDLDYFCWDDSRSSMLDAKLEITEEAYRSMTGNPYHPFRLLPKIIARAIEENGRYYLSYFAMPKPDPLPSEKQIKTRIKRFITWLASNAVSPRVISLCRSRHSGYTPARMWRAIEKRLLDDLKELCGYDAQS
ncbi:MAG: UPF0489 family protein [Synergistaceae bacterium]|jgi:hypothetical protein|nr:UPF0489 family protein [Synergistaceae bacterium]